MCYEWILTKKWLFVKIHDFLLHFHQLSRLSFWHQSTNKHANVCCSQHHKGFLSRGIHSNYPWIPIFSFTANGAFKLLHRREENVYFPSQEASASGLKVNHGGLGQILSSLENSLHMTHFRYPQILKREKKTHTFKTNRLCCKLNITTKNWSLLRLQIVSSWKHLRLLRKTAPRGSLSIMISIYWCCCHLPIYKVEWNVCF